MAPQISSLTSFAIISGSFLSGAMTSLSTITVPVFLETATTAPQLYHQWVRMFHYGHLSLPTISVGTALLYGYIAATRRSSRRPRWRAAALASVMTVIMVPFTWVVMKETNERLFWLEERNRGFLSGAGVQRSAEVEASSTISTTGDDMSTMAGIEEGRTLVVRWGWLHLTRSLFPLVGAVMGAWFV